MTAPAARVPPRFSTSSSIAWPGEGGLVKTRRGAGRTVSSQWWVASAVPRRVARSARVANTAAQSANSAVATPNPTSTWSVFTLPPSHLTVERPQSGEGPADSRNRALTRWQLHFENSGGFGSRRGLGASPPLALVVPAEDRQRHRAQYAADNAQDP